MSTHIGCLQVLSVLLSLLTSSSWQAQQAALVAIRSLAPQGPALQPWVPALVPALLEAACHSRPEVNRVHASAVACNKLDLAGALTAVILAVHCDRLVISTPLVWRCTLGG